MRVGRIDSASMGKCAIVAKRARVRAFVRTGEQTRSGTWQFLSRCITVLAIGDCPARSVTLRTKVSRQWLLVSR